jgi:hypothetical protein
MTTKSKALRAFLSGLSHQVPEKALPLLLKKEDDALIILLNSSIEGLPMGSPIRKSVDENLNEYVRCLRKELEKRLNEVQHAHKIDEEDADSVNTMLPVVNEDIFRLMINRPKSEKKSSETLALKCMDYSADEMLFQGKASIKNLITEFKRTLICRENEPNLNFFVRKIMAALAEKDHLLEQKMKYARNFLNIIQTSDISNISLDSFDIISAGDIGELVGSLTLFSILYPEKDLDIRQASNDDDEDGNSSDDETDMRPKKRRKMSKVELEKVRTECKKDVNIRLSLLFATMARANNGKVIVASCIMSFVDTILLKKDHVFKLFGLEAKEVDSSMRARLARDASSILLSSMELGNVIDRRELPSAALIADGMKRCTMINKWAQNTLSSLARAAVNNGNMLEHNGKSHTATFLLDRNPSEVQHEEEKLIGDESAHDDDSTFEEDEGESESKSPTKKHALKNRVQKSLFLPAVPEDEEAVCITDKTEDNNDTPYAAPSSPLVELVDSIQPMKGISQRTPTKYQYQKNSASSADTPSRITRSGTRGVSTTSSVDTDDDVASKPIIAKKNKAEKTASQTTSETLVTPRRRSSRRAANEESDSELSATPRRSTRKKK